MANICDQRVIIAANTKEDMAEVLEKMCQNVLDSPNGEEYFSKKDLENAKGDADALYELAKSPCGTMNLLCFFAKEPDSRVESGWMGWRIESVAGHPVIEIEIGVKWGDSFDPGKFCEKLDKGRFGYSISAGGEASEWMGLSIDDDWIEAKDLEDAVAKSNKAKNQAKSLDKIAYHVNLAGVTPDFYADAADCADW